jgi:hypothetical protein
VAVAVVVVDGLVDSEQPTGANMIVTTRSGVAHRIVRMLATADRRTVASTWLWLNVFTSRRMREIVCGPGLVGLQRVSRIGSCDINAGEMCWCSARTQLRHALGQRAEVDVNEIITGQIDILEARRFGGAWLLDQLGRRPDVGTALHPGRRRPAPGRHDRGAGAVRAGGGAGAGAGQQAGRHRLGGRAGRDPRLRRVFRRRGVSGDGLPARRPEREIAARIFGSVAHLLNLDVDIVFVDTTSTYWHVDVPDDLADLQPRTAARRRHFQVGRAGRAPIRQVQGPPRRTGPRW